MSYKAVPDVFKHLRETTLKANLPGRVYISNKARMLKAR